MLKGQLFFDIKMSQTPFCCASVVTPEQLTFIQPPLSCNLFASGCSLLRKCFCFCSCITNQVNVIIDALKCIQCFSCNQDLCFSNSPKICHDKLTYKKINLKKVFCFWAVGRVLRLLGKESIHFLRSPVRRFPSSLLPPLDSSRNVQCFQCAIQAVFMHA